MVFKVNIGTKEGKTWKLETESQTLVGKSLGDKIKGEEISPELSGYEFEIKGASDKSGFTALENVEGFGLKRILLKYGKGMHKRPKREGKKKISNKNPKGLRLRKTVHGKTLSENIVQINLKLVKQGGKKLEEIFPDQTPQPEQPTENPTEEKQEAKTE